MIVTVSEKGQVTIPKAVRDELGIAPGTTLDFQVANGKIIGTKRMPGDVFRKWRGRGKGAVAKIGGVDAYLRAARGA